MFTLSIVTQEKAVLEAEVSSIIAPGSEGYLGILTNHAPLITALVPGKLTVKYGDDREEIYAVSGGFLEVSENKATILADAVEPADKIDINRAEKALQRAKERLEKLEASINPERAESAKARAKNRISIYYEMHD